jgi:hypothetical protein
MLPRMRHWKPLFACLAAAVPVLACALACTTTTPSESPKVDASVYPAGNFGAPCTQPSDCTGGGWCDYPTTGGCGATGTCAAPPVGGADCVGTPVCPCDGGGVMFEGCGLGFPSTGLLDCQRAAGDAGPPNLDAGDAGDASDAEGSADSGDAGDAGDAGESSDASDAGDAADAL